MIGFTAAVGSVAKLLRAPLATGFLVSTLVSLAILGLRGCGSLESLELAASDCLSDFDPLTRGLIPASCW